MEELRSKAQEAAEDIFFGQAVIVWARWFVIAAVTLLFLWTSKSVGELTVAIILLVPLIAINFYVHGRYLMEKPANRYLLMALSAVDVIIVTLIVLFWTEDVGQASPYFILYYPLVLAFAFVFPARPTIAFTLLTLIIYSLASILANPIMVTDSIEIERLVVRLVTLGSMGALGTYYWRVQRARRREQGASSLTESAVI
jgi:hypothetical protein